MGQFAKEFHHSCHSSAGNVATWVISKCAVTQNREKGRILVAVRVVVVETLEEKVVDEGEEIHMANVMHAK